MSGPIVRSGPSPEFTKNWEQVFGKKSAQTDAKAAKAAQPKPAKKKKKQQ